MFFYLPQSKGATEFSLSLFMKSQNAFSARNFLIQQLFFTTEPQSDGVTQR
jgi:hypothetical protein